jgi:hypothetical protein
VVAVLVELVGPLKEGLEQESMLMLALALGLSLAADLQWYWEQK